jgi:protein associated with RNAse G/E
VKKILEIKRHLNKPDETYHCDLIERGTDDVLLRYVSDRSGRVGEVTFEVGSITYAYYKTGEGYVLWKMLGPDGSLKGYLFHICCDLKVAKDRVEYLDLLLDIWIGADGKPTILDRDEVRDCASQGMIGEKELSWIDCHEREIIQNWRQMISRINLTPLGDH